MIYFICGNDYQIMKAAAYGLDHNQPVHIFCTHTTEYNDIPNVTMSYVDEELITDFNIHKLSAEDEANIKFVKVLYNLDKELHVFEYLDDLFEFGRDNVILHDQGDASYIENMYGLMGAANHDTIFTIYTQHQIDDERNEHWDFNKAVDKHRSEISKIFTTKGLYKDIPENTILFVHNEPDYKYTPAEKKQLNIEIIDLLEQFELNGYNIWVKLHHKRPSSIDFQKYASNVIYNIPLELIPDLDKFKYVVSVRNSGIENMNLPNTINGLTKEAITLCKKNWKYVYSRGIQKIKKKLNLN